MNKLYYDIYKKGYYYADTKTRYIDSPTTCDRCLKENLISCIGWKDHDLCMQCIAFIDELIANKLYCD
jgi:hypothetical protein